MIRKLHAFGKRFAVMLSGEVLQSAFGFALNISLVRTLSAEHYGVFAIVILIGGLGIFYMRALVGVPACIYIPQSRRPRDAAFYAVMFGSAALAVAGLWAVLVGLLLLIWQPAGAMTGGIVAGGLFAGAWALRFYVRMALFAQGRAGLATASDLVFTITGTALCVPVILLVRGDAVLEGVLLALTFAHLAGAGLSFAVQRQRLRFSLNRAIRIRLAKLLPSMTWSLVSVTAANIQGQGAVLLLAAIAGPAAYAPIAAVMTFFSPLRLAAFALANMTQPDFATTMARQGPRAVLGTLLLSTGMMVAVCGTYGLLMIWAFPFLSAHAFAGRFGDAPLGLIAILVWSIATFAVLYSVPRTLLETVQKYRENTLLAALAAAAGLPLVAFLLVTISPVWSLAGLLVSEGVILAGSWLAVRPVVNHVPGTIRPAGAGFARYFSGPGIVPVAIAAAADLDARV